MIQLNSTGPWGLTYVNPALARGGRPRACTPCVKARGYEQSDLIAGVEIAGSSVMQGRIKAGAASVS